MENNPSESGPRPEERSEAPKQPEAQETPDQLRERIASAVKNEVGKEAGIVDRLQKDPQSSAKTIEVRILQNPTTLAYLKSDPDLSKGADDIRSAVRQGVQNALQAAA